MRVLFGHPTGNPNSHHAALAHFESGRLEAFCTAWMPTPRQIQVFKSLPGVNELAARLSRRCFEPLLNAPRVEDPLGEWMRLAKRLLFRDPEYTESLAYDANDWLMRTMAREISRRSETEIVHSYEDCSLLQFQAAAKVDKCCVYDMPIGYYPVWRQTQQQLTERFRDWLSPLLLKPNKWVRPEQKREEMELADLVLVPSTFAENSILQFCDKRISLAPYGVDSDFWKPLSAPKNDRAMRFIYVGQINVRKGSPILLQAWQKSGLVKEELILVGDWQLLDSVRKEMPANVRHVGSCSAATVRDFYRQADVFVFPSFFDGFGLVLLEAMACGLPILASECCAAPDFVSEENGTIVPAGDVDAWVAALRSAARDRDRFFEMRTAARATAVRHNWAEYRKTVSQAIQAIA